MPSLMLLVMHDVSRIHDVLSAWREAGAPAVTILDSVGTCELVGRRDVPARVIITEHVDLAHAFYDGPEPGMVNGVLDRLARSLRPGELEDGNRDGSAASQ